jgi:hypothetical protein
MKRTMTALVISAALSVLSAGACAQGALPQSEFSAELGAALQEMSAEQLGTLTVADLVKLAERISISEQEARYVLRARMASRFLPGAGQLMTGDTASGALFLAGDLALTAGTVVGAYLLLPSSVQFSSIDYLNDPISSIRSKWEGNSIVAYLPSFAVGLVGMILQHVVLGHFASIEAAKSARRNIADGKVTFTPNFDFLGRPGMGFRMRY